MINVKQPQHVTYASMVFVEQRVPPPAPLHRNAVHQKDHVTSVWWVLALLEVAVLPVPSNPIALAMETALFAQRGMDVLQLVVDLVL